MKECVVVDIMIDWPLTEGRVAIFCTRTESHSRCRDWIEPEGKEVQCDTHAVKGVSFSTFVCKVTLSGVLRVLFFIPNTVHLSYVPQ